MEGLYDDTEAEEISRVERYMVSHQAAEEPHAINIPIILAGYTGSGKDTVSHAATKLAETTESGHSFQHSASRYTDRTPRPGEIQGDHGHFVSQAVFDKLKDEGEFFYDYQKMAYGGVCYGFSLPILERELESKHTFIVGGEIDTALGLKNALDHVHEEDDLTELEQERNVIKSGIRKKTEKAVHPLILFVNRPVDQIIKGIKNREAGEAEKNKRIEHVQKHWEKFPKILDKAKGGVEVVWNVELDKAAQQIIRAVQSRVDKQMRDTYGNKMKSISLM